MNISNSNKKTKTNNSFLLKQNKELRDDIDLLIGLPQGHPVKKAIEIKYTQNLTKTQFKELIISIANNEWKLETIKQEEINDTPEQQENISN